MTYWDNIVELMNNETYNIRRNISFVPHDTKFTKEGCTLIGWGDESHKSDKIPQYPVGKLIEGGFPSDIDLYAIWSNDLVTVKFIANGGTEVPNAQVPTHTLFGDIPHQTERLGYDFVNWFTELFGGQAIQNDFIIMNDLTAYARWNIIEYAISYEMNGHGIKPSSNSYTVEDEYTPENPSEIGWTFKGWNPTKINKGTTGNVTFTASWQINTYTISTIASPSENGSVSGGGTYNYGSSVTLIATPSPGYVFVKWNDNVTTSTRTITVTNNVTYTAIFWKKEIINPTKDSFDIKSVSSISYQHPSYGYMDWNIFPDLPVWSSDINEIAKENALSQALYGKTVIPKGYIGKIYSSVSSGVCGCAMNSITMNSNQRILITKISISPYVAT